MPKGSTLFSFYLTLSDPEPPSVNALYSTGRHGQRFLTKAGAKFKTALTQEAVRQISPMPWAQAVDAAYVEQATIDLWIVMQFPIFNGSWKPGGRTKSGELQSPYKKKDVSSYCKVIEDAIVDATGIDDSFHFGVYLIKRDGPPMVEIYYEVNT